jgi:hypothetical protein
MQGPLRPSRGRDAFRAERADVLSVATGGVRSPAQCLARLCRQDEALEQWSEHDETVLWVDACLYDQAILVRLLHHFAELPGAVSRLRLVCLGQHMDVPEFHGLGQLTPAQLAALLPDRKVVSPEQCAVAQQAWNALCATSPARVEALARQEDIPSLPYLQPALRRWLESLPSTTHGLCRLQHEILALLAARGELNPVAVFRHVSALERPAFFGDTYLWKCLNDMAFCRCPLVRFEPHLPLPLWDGHGLAERRLSLTPQGAGVIAGRADAITLNGIDRWLGGVRLDGESQSPWRWNPSAQRVEAAG